MRHFHFVLLLILALGNTLFANNDKFFVKPQSSWVENITYNDKNATGSIDTEDGAIYYLSDYQSNVITLEKYYRSVIKIVNEVGIKNYADIWVSYDPNYQELNFHSIKIHRGGKVYNRLEKSKFKIIQNESELENNIFNGSFSAGYFIEDVQVGDIIEYSYAIVGENPIFKGNYFDFFYLQFSTPVKKIHCSVRFSKDSKVNYKLFNTLQQPLRAEKDGLVVLKWESENVQELITNSQQPSWYSPYPKVQISSFNSWTDLIKWGEKLYPPDGLKGGKLKKQFDAIISKCNTPESKINALIQFVKDEIRYVGIEISEYSHKPRRPEEVFQKRFGDCKEKSYMLSSMLKKIGVESYVAYVNTNLKHRIVEYLPSPTIFNHAIVAIKYREKFYFVDPTITGQKGDFTNFFNGNYKQALIVDPKFTEPILISDSGDERVVVKEIIEVIDSVKPVQYTVHSTYYGSEADRIRNQFKSNTKKQLENSYLNFYSTNYSKMRFRDSLVLEDDPELNCVKVTEKYDIESFWKKDSSTNNRIAYLDAPNLKSYLTSPEQRNRKHPFYLYYPIEVENEITFKHAEDFNIDEVNKQINNPCFSFKYIISKVNSTTITFKYNYKSLKDYVDTTEMNKYFNDYDEIRNETYYTFTWRKNSTQTSKTNWMFIILTVFFVTILLFIANALYQKDISKPYINNPLPIGGWLVLIAIGLFITPITLLFDFVKNGFFNQTSWEFISTPTSAGYDVVWSFAFVYELLMNCLMMVYIIFILVLFIKRRTTFPIHFIIFRLIHFVLIIGDVILVSKITNSNFIADNSSVSPVVSSIVASCIWIPYMIYSERVKDTFVFKHKRNIDLEQSKNDVQSIS
ncbi:MAG TPA: hypothetical protein DIW31_03225 [Bacteroidales bacterium]|nr:hypothetical protein [Bacteroidales bacterium]